MQRTQSAAGVPVSAACQAGDGLSEDSSPPLVAPTSAMGKIAALPEHLGWRSKRLTAMLRNARQCPQSECDDANTQNEPHLPQQSNKALLIDQVTDEFSHPQSETIKLFPDIALGMLRQEQAPAGRIWLLLRHIDAQGSGWVPIEVAREQLTRKDSKLRVCGWRRLRQILAHGEGVFWRRDKTRIWLRGAAKVTAALDVERLTARPVALPLKTLLGGIGTVRAHFYASFHSGRRSSMPISRKTLTEISNTSASAQRMYERETGVTSRRNMAIGESYTTENIQKRAWLHGKAIFDFIDHHGRQGPAKKHYLSWHLPNSYEGCHQRSPKGRMKKINHQIDLVNKRAQGNGLQDCLFHAAGAQAAKAHNRQPMNDGYWYSETGRRKRQVLWYVLSKQDK